MQVPLAYAEDIIGIAGRNIAYIRRTSGAVLTVQESLGRGDEITVEIKGTASQVQTAQQLIQVCSPYCLFFIHRLVLVEYIWNVLYSNFKSTIVQFEHLLFKMGPTLKKLAEKSYVPFRTQVPCP